MKTNNKLKATHLMLTLVILAGGVMSCEKTEECNPHEARLTITNLPSDRGGDDEEEPIVQGIVENGNHTAISGAYVELIKVGDSTATDSDTTDTNGHFEVSAAAGNYFFKVTIGGTSTTTGSFNLTVSVFVTITV